MKPLKLLFLLFFVVGELVAKQIFPSEPFVRVRIINSLDSLNLTFSGMWWIHNYQGDSLAISNQQQLQILSRSGQILLADSTGQNMEASQSYRLTAGNDSSTVLVRDVPYGVGWWWAGQEDRIYGGELHVFLGDELQMTVVIKLALETYLKGVVPYEIGPNSPLEALKAQAVAARSEAVIALTSKLYSGSHHDLTSDVECQVFSGNKRRSEASDRAVEETRGLVISENGQTINAFYASNCGGRSELIENVWPSRSQPETYLVSRSDKPWQVVPNLSWNWLARRWIKKSPRVYCNPEFNPVLPDWSKKNFRWTREFKINELTSMLTEDPSMGSFKKIKVLKRGVSGRIIKARFIFENGSFIKEGELSIRQLFNPSLRSSNFYVKRQGDQVVFYGAGWGHGVGMCQSGAIAQASKGKSFEEILQHYYSRATLLDIYSGK